MKIFVAGATGARGRALVPLLAHGHEVVGMTRSTSKQDLLRSLGARPVRKRRFPIVGGGGGVWSHVHIDDAATATVAAVAHGQPGIYNVVDDEPAPMREWLPALASALEAKPPWRVPRWLGQLAAGEAATLMMTEARGASNEKAKRELGWQPRYGTWRVGFVKGLD
ncbi:MAG TPA: hypothetical protein VMF65_17895 [Acidimicrobiales bacterium]|nr:hypothetical protein [Acidimicrobiales bacterium]